MKQFILYARVSTAKQEHGLDAQRAQALRYVDGVGGHIVAEFSEHVTGKDDERQELKNAIAACRKTGATLLIAKLDRLSRNAAFLHKLRDDLTKAGVEVIAADMPEMLSNTLMLSVMAGMAQYERETISKRTKEALDMVKKHGSKSGKPIGRPKGYKHSPETRAKIAASMAKRNEDKMRDHLKISIAKEKRAQGKTLKQIAAEMNDLGLTAPNGGKINYSHVSRFLK